MEILLCLLTLKTAFQFSHLHENQQKSRMNSVIWKRYSEMDATVGVCSSILSSETDVHMIDSKICSLRD